MNLVVDIFLAFSQLCIAKLNCSICRMFINSKLTLCSVHPAHSVWSFEFMIQIWSPQFQFGVPVFNKLCHGLIVTGDSPGRLLVHYGSEIFIALFMPRMLFYMLSNN